MFSKFIPFVACKCFIFFYGQIIIIRAWFILSSKTIAGPSKTITPYDSQGEIYVELSHLINLQLFQPNTWMFLMSRFYYMKWKMCWYGQWVSQVVLFFLLYSNTIYAAKAAVIKYHTLGGLKKGIYFLTFLEFRSLRSRYHQDWFLVRPLSFGLSSVCRERER